ncbi:MAG: GIY-YIG nuclease family protein [Elusimicrobiales bacterium]|nr:GIY-YIG nuclease family protein [Elusimicrobiales bacterium]
MRDYASLPRSPGVYLMKDAAGTVLYVGKAKDLRKRVAQYFMKGAPEKGGWKIPNLVPLIRAIDYIPCAGEKDALLLERDLIGRLQPFFNAMWKDSKSYARVRLTMSEDFPRVFMTRSPGSEGDLVFGPYPKAEALKKLLAYLWRTGFINLRYCRWDFSRKKPLDRRKIDACLYYHTGQCTAPCDGKISFRAYRALALRVKRFFEGDFGALEREFRAGMRRSSADRDYESAALFRDMLSALDHMSERTMIRRLDPAAIDWTVDRSRGATRLAELLGLKSPPLHIEAFDTSSLFGRQPVGSSVCFRDGEPHKAHYRRYRIRTAPPGSGSDDFAMIGEIVGRRLAALRRSGEPMPDLLLIDGGRGQLSAALAAAKLAGVGVPIVSLAKEFEEIMVPGRPEPLRLAAGDPALRLLQSLRDEAHRFGITYHRGLRGRSELEE